MTDLAQRAADALHKLHSGRQEFVPIPRDTHTTLHSSKNNDRKASVRFDDSDSDSDSDVAQPPVGTPEVPLRAAILTKDLPELDIDDDSPAAAPADVAPVDVAPAPAPAPAPPPKRPRVPHRASPTTTQNPASTCGAKPVVSNAADGDVDSDVGTFRAASLTLLGQMIPLNKPHKKPQSSPAVDDAVNAYVDAHCAPVKIRSSADKRGLALKTASEDPVVARILEERHALGDDAWLPPGFVRDETTNIVTPSRKKRRGSMLGYDSAFRAAAIEARQAREQKAHDLLNAAWAKSQVT